MKLVMVKKNEKSMGTGGHKQLIWCFTPSQSLGLYQGEAGGQKWRAELEVLDQTAQVSQQSECF